MVRRLPVLFLFLSQLFPAKAPAQYEILKLSGRTTPAGFYEVRGDFLFYRRPDLGHAVVFTCRDQAIADSLRVLLAANPSMDLKAIDSALSPEKGSVAIERKSFRRNEDPGFKTDPWQTGLTDNWVQDGKVIFGEIRSIEQDKHLRRLNRYDLFSVIRAGGGEEVLYDPDTTAESGDPTEEEVRHYIKGEQYAMKAYHKPIHRPAGAAVGLASSFGGLYGPLGVFAYAMVISRHNPKHVPPTDTIDPAVFGTDEFVRGYQKYARNKKARQSLIWGGIGFAVGFPVFLAIFHE